MKPTPESETSEGLRQRKRRETRAALSHATIRLCMQRGWDNATVEEIAAAANVSPRTFRNYFANKAEAVAAGHMERLLRIADELRTRPANEELWAAITNAVAVQFEPPKQKSGSPVDVKKWLERIRFLFTEPAIRGEVLKAGAAAQRELARAVAQRTGRTRANDLYPQLVAAVVIAAIGVIQERWLQDGPTAPIVPLLRSAFGLIAAGFPEKGEASAGRSRSSSISQFQMRPSMRIRGITYDTGFASAGTTTHEPFVPERVRREMQIIRNDLHCNGVRITGAHPDRLEIAAKYAAEAGLEVWFCPFTNGLTREELFDLLLDCAERAERLRRQGAEVVFLTGSEISLFTSGFVPGESHEERLALLRSPQELRQQIGGIRARINEFLARAVEAIRLRFGGKLSYASIPFEGIDWSRFDIIATDAGYRAAEFAARFRDDIRAFVAQGRAQGKPVAVTEFGCATFRGASALANRDDSMIEWGTGARPIGLKGEFVRDEEEQALYLAELLEVFESEGVDNVFVYTFARYDLTYRCASGEDFDLVSAGVVKVLEGGRGELYPDMPWEPKAAFSALAGHYQRGV